MIPHIVRSLVLALFCVWSGSLSCPRSRQDLPCGGVLSSLISLCQHSCPRLEVNCGIFTSASRVTPVFFYAMLPTLRHQISSNLVAGPEAKPPRCNKDMWYRLFHFSSRSSYNIIKNTLNFNVPYKICACESKHR